LPYKYRRVYPSVPFKILDAPGYSDDFYHNILDWSVKNCIVIGLGKAIYVYNFGTAKVSKLFQLGEDEEVCSLKWSPQGEYLSVGTNLGDVMIFDTESEKKVRTLKGHEGRTSAAAWSNKLLSTGGKDRMIYHRDLRCAKDYVSESRAHK
jgi:cell division cycle 20-like protein 1, cofactor of APC complex